MTTSCRAIDGINAAQLAAMARLNQKINGLRRTAELLAAAKNPAGLMPDISRLIPLRDIDSTAFQRMAAACPAIFAGLGHPPSLEDLRSRLLVSYRCLFDSLNNHPWSRLGLLQGKLDRLQAQLSNLGLDRIGAFLACAAAVCDATQQLPEDIKQQGKVVQDYTRNFVTNSGQVLTAPLQFKQAQVEQLKEQVKDLAN